MSQGNGNPVVGHHRFHLPFTFFPAFVFRLGPLFLWPSSPIAKYLSTWFWWICSLLTCRFVRCLFKFGPSWVQPCPTTHFWSRWWLKDVDCFLFLTAGVSSSLVSCSQSFGSVSLSWLSSSLSSVSDSSSKSRTALRFLGLTISSFASCSSFSPPSTLSSSFSP